MGIFSAEVEAVKVDDVAELARQIRLGTYYCVGASHSYNGIQIVGDGRALIMRDSGLKSIDYDPTSGNVRVGASVTILELKEYLVRRGRRLINSGNFMAQTMVGALVTGTHGYGHEPVMAEAIVEIEFLDESGNLVRLRAEDADFVYAVLSFGAIAPIVAVTVRTAPVGSFEADSIICRLSQKAQYVRPEDAVVFAVLPYSNVDDPTIALQTLRPATSGDVAHKTTSPIFTLRRISEFIITRYWIFDRLFPALRRPFQRLIARLDLKYHHRDITDPKDLNYLYDPTAGPKNHRSLNILRELFDPAYTAYNLAFFVRLDDVTDVIRFLMHEAEQLRKLGFYLKTMVSVRELTSRSELPFAGNFDGPVAAIDLFADVRDYAWLERLQRDILAYFPNVRPHWGKSAIVDEWVDSIGPEHIDALRALHLKYYPSDQLRMVTPIRRLLGLPVTPPGTHATPRVRDTETRGTVVLQNEALHVR